jgi:hypothetical protein
MQQSTQNTPPGGSPAPAATSVDALASAQQALTDARDQFAAASKTGTYNERHQAIDDMRAAVAEVDRLKSGSA